MEMSSPQASRVLNVLWCFISVASRKSIWSTDRDAWHTGMGQISELR
jgi:hypothetical protein